MKEKYENYLIYGLVVFVFIVLLYSLGSMILNNSFSKQTDADKTNIVDNLQSKSNQQTIVTGSTNPGEVSIELTPFGFNDNKMKFSISINTHSVDLSSFDLKKITTLEFDGTKIHPISAPNLNGHHNSGELIFEINQEINNFKVIITGIPKVEERIFKWN